MTDESFPPPASRHHNQPPLEDRIVVEFDQALEEAGIMNRLGQLVERGADPADCTDKERAGRYGDYIKLVGACDKAIEEERERLNRPLLTAQRNLKGRADSLRDQLKQAAGRVRAKLDAFMAAERKAAEEERQKQERIRQAAADAAREQARKEWQEEQDRLAEQREAERAAAAPVDELPLAPAPEPEPVFVEPVVEIAAVKVEAPVARGDYGARVGTKTVWKHEIESVRKLPDHVLKHEKVVAALDQVIGAMVRSGTRDLKGTRIYSEEVTSIR